MALGRQGGPTLRMTRLSLARPPLSASRSGWRRARHTIAASALFDRDWYVTQYPEAQGSGLDPLEHYVLHGAAHAYDPNPLFDTDWYLAQNPDVAAAGLNPLAHYIRFGAAQGRDPS